MRELRPNHCEGQPVSYPPAVLAVARGDQWRPGLEFGSRRSSLQPPSFLTQLARIHRGALLRAGTMGLQPWVQLPVMRASRRVNTAPPTVLRDDASLFQCTSFDLMPPNTASVRRDMEIGGPAVTLRDLALNAVRRLLENPDNDVEEILFLADCIKAWARPRSESASFWRTGGTCSGLTLRPGTRSSLRAHSWHALGAHAPGASAGHALRAGARGTHLKRRGLAPGVLVGGPSGGRPGAARNRERGSPKVSL